MVIRNNNKKTRAERKGGREIAVKVVTTNLHKSLTSLQIEQQLAIYQQNRHCYYVVEKFQMLLCMSMNHIKGRNKVSPYQEFNIVVLCSNHSGKIHSIL